MPEQEKNRKPGTFPPGVSGNPNGRPKGQRDYATIYRAALERIGKEDNLTPEEIEEIMEESGLRQALKGNFAFYRDIRDRLHGKPAQAVELSGKDGGPIEQSITVTLVE